MREEYIGFSVVERTSRLHLFSDVGPADLCNIHKVSPTAKKPDLSTFLYYTGVDTLNLALIAAHLQSLANLLTKGQVWFGEKKHFKVPELTYCTWNAFSRTDMRVTVHIPGQFETQVVAADGKLAEGTEALWMETFVCGVVRSLLELDDDDANKVGGLVEIRREYGLFREQAVQFLHGFEKLFFKGPRLGCGVELLTPTLVYNYLVEAFFKCVELTQLYAEAHEVLQRLQERDPAVATLTARLLLMKDEEVEAVRVMTLAVEQHPRDPEMLILQGHFLLDKGRLDLALHLAQSAVKAAPSDFRAWALLVLVYTRLGDYEHALLTLNSCPMNTHRDHFQLRRLVPVRGEDLHLPSPTDVVLEEVTGLQAGALTLEQKTLDPQLAALPAAGLKLTFARAYDLLAEIAVKTGWDALLRHRGKVFVMAEEIKKDRGHLRKGLVQDDASTVAVKLPSPEEEYRKKRLCERWLDNMFLILYDDLRAYTMWQAEFVHFQAQQMEFQRTPLEWEVLGRVAFRLKHFKEGAVAFDKLLARRFSPRSEREMLKFYVLERARLAREQGQLPKTTSHLNERILELCIRLLVWNHRWYNDFSPALFGVFADLVAREGMIKVQLMVLAVYANSVNFAEGQARGITDMVEELYAYVKGHSLAGCDN